MSILPSVRANLAERLIFNFRMAPEALAAFLPVPWLTPDVVRGYGVVSFCLLDLRQITLAPLPAVAGLASVSCAPRFAVRDRSGGGDAPAVYVTERQTNSAFGAWFTSLGFSAPHPHVTVDLRRLGDRTEIRVEDGKAGEVFYATVGEAQHAESKLFDSPEVFAAFIAGGVTSYGTSRHKGKLTKVDLHKLDCVYTPLAASNVSGPLVQAWHSAGGVLDSAYRTMGGQYEWEYHGLVEEATGRP
ncbi:hypothetical protein BH09VER1_BH09VER1_18170 [soil metagenome]